SSRRRPAEQLGRGKRKASRKVAKKRKGRKEKLLRKKAFRRSLRSLRSSRFFAALREIAVAVL
ncbi:MAG TPA: hypothetical protein VNX47_05750, partial [Nevskia sp.]|nr:hypothetical protein [Nevskia sp.]